MLIAAAPRRPQRTDGGRRRPHRDSDSAARQAVGPGGHGGPGSPGLLRLSIWHLGAQAIEVLIILLAVLWMYLEI